jgi:hypothetical protein
MRLVEKSASYTGLLGVLAFALIAARIAPISSFLTIALEILIVFAMVVVVRQLRARPVLLIVVAMAAVVAELSSVISAIRPEPIWVVLDHATTVLFLALVLGRILVDVWQQKVVDIDTIVGGIVVYLLVGVAFAGVYQLLEFVAPGSFVVSNPDAGRWGEWQTDPGTYPRLFFFSFVTLTTLGYGDLVPASEAAGALTSLEAAGGALYLTILIARLVGLHIAASTAAARGD